MINPMRIDMESNKSFRAKKKKKKIELRHIGK